MANRSVGVALAISTKFTDDDFGNALSFAQRVLECPASPLASTSDVTRQLQRSKANKAKTAADQSKAKRTKCRDFSSSSSSSREQFDSFSASKYYSDIPNLAYMDNATSLFIIRQMLKRYGEQSREEESR
ncbi:unnamed protein product [Soboliphyme baturini]|uniref:Tetratricopeptide repeat (TPR)-like superfamily protein n=1 Tax=Soboliphyme baturini TaxID=241478 RepID=A0A183J0F9_9BILA|nr:unnamed protein product [Soboliphyme baturini]